MLKNVLLCKLTLEKACDEKFTQTILVFGHRAQQQSSITTRFLSNPTTGFRSFDAAHRATPSWYRNVICIPSVILIPAFLLNSSAGVCIWYCRVVFRFMNRYLTTSFRGNIDQLITITITSSYSCNIIIRYRLQQNNFHLLSQMQSS